jgi:ABC-type multidrug transport system ATPase subunit
MIVERYICTLTIMRVHNFSGGLITIYCCHNMADIEELPEEVAFLENAVDAAFQKARRYNCRAVYYAA